MSTRFLDVSQVSLPSQSPLISSQASLASNFMIRLIIHENKNVHYCARNINVNSAIDIAYLMTLKLNIIASFLR